jgi:hypothetical protein
MAFGPYRGEGTGQRLLVSAEARVIGALIDAGRNSAPWADIRLYRHEIEFYQAVRESGGTVSCATLKVAIRRLGLREAFPSVWYAAVFALLAFAVRRIASLAAQEHAGRFDGISFRTQAAPQTAEH